jgi:hypothetical protein
MRPATRGSGVPPEFFQLSDLERKSGHRTLDAVPVRVARLLQHAIVLFQSDIPAVPTLLLDRKTPGVTGAMKLFYEHD